MYVATLTWHIVNAEHPPTLIDALLQALSLQETCGGST